MSRVHRCAAAILAAGLLLGTAACGAASPSADLPKPAQSRIGLPESTSNQEFMRVRFYKSLGDLKKDSPVIAAGIVTGQKVTTDVDGSLKVTLSDFHVLDVSKGNVKPGQTLVIRQSGANDALILKKREVTLLFLNLVGNDNKAYKGQYAIRGVDAGIYELSDPSSFTTLTASADGKGSADDVRFSRFMKTDSDRLPTTITLKQVKAA